MSMSMIQPKHTLVLSAITASRKTTNPRKRKRTRDAATTDGHTEIAFNSKTPNGFAFFSNLWPDVDSDALQATPERVRSEVKQRDHLYGFEMLHDGRKIRFRSIQHAYHWKQYVHTHPDRALRLLNCPTAQSCKKLAAVYRKRRLIDLHAREAELEIWTRKCLAAKFESSVPLRNALIATRGRRIRETERVQKPSNLGQLLTELRDRIILRQNKS